jgi:hypothetical protein
MTYLRLLWIAGAIVLAGCAGRAVAPSMFLLDIAAPTPGAQTKPGDAPALVIDRVKVAPYLDEAGIVYQTALHRVVLARNNRWASPLATQLTGALQATLENTVDNASIRRSGSNNPGAALHLVTHVDEFMGHYDGHAHIGGRWQLIDADGRRVADSHFEQRVALSDDGYDALVDSLSRGWQRSAQTLGQRLTRLLAER